MMFVTLFTSRVVLDKLGVIDYGIYNVVGGIVAMLGFLNSSMSNAVQRYLSFEIGKKNDDGVNRVFNVSLLAHTGIAIFVLVAAEIVGVWYLNTYMNIPFERMDAANWVLQCSIFSTLFSIVQVPYNAIILSIERMGIYAYISILEVVLKLLVVYMLSIGNFDKLKLYSVLIMMVSICIMMIYMFYCAKKYKEAKFRLIKDRCLLRQIIGFASWNMIGSTSVILSDQGVNVLLNIFCNPIVNAARGVAMQVNQAINSFAQNFMLALNPQITKSFGTNNLESFKSFMIYGSRLSVALLTLLSLPILADTKFILHLWLGQVPDYSVNFVRLALLYTLSESMSGTFTTGLLATGKIMKLQLLVGGFRMMNFPLSYGALLLWKIPEITFIIAIAISQINLFIRLTLLRKYVEISRFVYYKDIVLRQILTILIPLFIIYLLSSYMDESCVRLLMIVIISMCTCMICILYVTCNKYERILIFGKLYNILRKLGR